MTQIAVEHVSKSIHGTEVLHDVSLELHSGLIYGLQGVNGSGKTMLMRVLTGMIRPTKGSVQIDSKRLGTDLAFPESVGLLLENPAFLDRYSGLENLCMLASIRGLISDNEARSVMAQVGLDPENKKKYRKYSLGMKQRLGIAAAVMEKPDIVILDEPTNALDTSGVAMVKQLLLDQKARGALTLISCHDLSILQALSDEIFVLEEGRLTGHLIPEKAKEAAACASAS